MIMALKINISSRTVSCESDILQGTSVSCLPRRGVLKWKVCGTKLEDFGHDSCDLRECRRCDRFLFHKAGYALWELPGTMEEQYVDEQYVERQYGEEEYVE